MHEKWKLRINRKREAGSAVRKNEQANIIPSLTFPITIIQHTLPLHREQQEEGMLVYLQIVLETGILTALLLHLLLEGVKFEKQKRGYLKKGLNIYIYII